MASKIYVVSSSEHEFWRREFQAEVLIKDEDYLARLKDLIRSGVKPVIQVGPSRQEAFDLMELPKASVIVQFHADETYLPKVNFQIIRNPAVSMILRSYPIPKLKFSRFFVSQYSGLKDLSHNFTFSNFLEYLKLFFAGIIMVKRQVFIFILERIYSKVSVPMPLGYTDLFAESYLKVNSINNDLSLIEFKLDNLNVEGRYFKIAFVGQLGKLTRRVAIEATKNISPKKLVIRKNYGGAVGIYGASLESGIENIQTLMSSKLSLCPPGNYSNNTFRISESLICGAFPVFSQSSISDPFCSFSYLDDGILGLPYPWKMKIEIASGFDDSFLGSCVDTSLLNLSSQIARVKRVIIEAQE